MNVEDGQLLVALEDVETPLGARLAGLLGLAVLDDHAVDDVGVLEKLARGLHGDLVVLGDGRRGRSSRRLSTLRLGDFGSQRAHVILWDWAFRRRDLS